MERASTKLRIGAFHGKYHTCNTRDVCKIIFIKVSRRLGVLVASTPGNTSKGPRAKRTKPNHHTLGRKRKIRKRIAPNLHGQSCIYRPSWSNISNQQDTLQSNTIKYNQQLTAYSQMIDVRRMGKRIIEDLSEWFVNPWMWSSNAKSRYQTYSHCLAFLWHCSFRLCCWCCLMVCLIVLRCVWWSLIPWGCLIVVHGSS